jgi:hypothetical protein
MANVNATVKKNSVFRANVNATMQKTLFAGPMLTQPLKKTAFAGQTLRQPSKKTLSGGQTVVGGRTKRATFGGMSAQRRMTGGANAPPTALREGRVKFTASPGRGRASRWGPGGGCGRVR